MAKLLKLRRGTTSQHSSFTGAEGEVTVDTTKDTIVVHDGSTAGGVPLAKESDNLSLIDEDNMATNSATRPPSQQSVKAYVDAGDLSLIDEDNMSTDSATRPPSQQSVKAYVDAKVPTSITVADESSDTTCFPLFVTAATGDLAPKTGSNFTFNSSTGKVVIGGDLQVQGTTTTVDSTTMSVADKNIELAKGAANDAAADGGGITLVSGDGNKTFNWVDSTDAWTSSEHIHLGDSKTLHLGTGQDFQLYHDGTNNILRNVGTRLDIIVNSSETAAVFNPNGSVDLYHDNTKKIETTAAGVTVSGSVTDDKGNVRSIPSNAQGGAYVGVAADAGKAIYISTGGVTINNSVFSAGDAVTIINNSGSDQTITQGSGVTIHNTADAATGNRTLAGRGMATIWFASASVAYISGAGLS